MSEENKSPLDGAIWHHMDAATIAGFGPWVRHADHVAEIERLRAKLAEAEKVIEPFNDMAKHHAADAPEWRDHHAVHAMVLVGHLRAAAEWMEKGDD